MHCGVPVGAVGISARPGSSVGIVYVRQRDAKYQSSAAELRFDLDGRARLDAEDGLTPP